MATFIFILVLIAASCVLAYRSIRLPYAMSVYVVIAALFHWIIQPSIIVQVLFWLVLLFVLLGSCLKFLRRKLFTNAVFTWFANQQPVLSQAEQEVLNAGGTSFEKDIFTSSPDLAELSAQPTITLTKQEQSFLENEVEHLCAMIDPIAMDAGNKDLSDAAWAYIKANGFLGIVISTEYGGLGFSAQAHSAIVHKVASCHIGAAISVMVPNSLGPGELITLYGTQEQKSYYLPRLAQGLELPCFGLTAPTAGSDAASIHDKGVVCYQMFNGEKTLGILLNFEKRYISLAPIATLIGLAFKLYDPEHLLGDKNYIGITIGLLDASLPGINTTMRHNPLDVSFTNGPIYGKDVFMPLDAVLGGVEKTGKGWQMLMECLSIGRGISLPALATAACKYACRVSANYATIRQQFRQPLKNFEGVSILLGESAMLAYQAEAVRDFLVAAVENDTKPAIASAVAKYHLTEMARLAVNHAMDIHAGKGIQLGPNNYLANLYRSIPICITVEGANILTRNLIIFGQAALRAHPFLRQEMDCLEDVESPEKQANFDRLFFKHAMHVTSQLVRGVTDAFSGGYFISSKLPKHLRYAQVQLTRFSNAFALLSELAFVYYGPKLKLHESLSAKIGDMLSYLLMASACVKYFVSREYCNEELAIFKVSFNDLMYKAQNAFEAVIFNFKPSLSAKFLKQLLFLFGMPIKPVADDDKLMLADNITQTGYLRNLLASYLYTPTDLTKGYGLLEQTYKQYNELADVYSIIQQAVPDKRLAVGEKAQKCFELGFITQAQLTNFGQLQNNIRDVIAVDSFSNNTFTGEYNGDKAEQNFVKC